MSHGAGACSSKSPGTFWHASKRKACPEEEADPHRRPHFGRLRLRALVWYIIYIYICRHVYGIEFLYMVCIYIYRYLSGIEFWVYDIQYGP